MNVQRKQLTLLEGHDSEPAPADLEKFAIVHEDKLQHAVAQCVKTSPEYKKAAEKASEAKRGLMGTAMGMMPFSRTSSTPTDDQKEAEDLGRDISGRVHGFLHDKIKGDFINLQIKVSECLQHTWRLDEETSEVQPFPEDARSQLFKIFNDELQRMQQEEKQEPLVKYKRQEGLLNFKRDEVHVVGCIRYTYPAYEHAFTQTFFNQLVMQVERNDEVQKQFFKTILLKKADEAINFHAELQHHVDGTLGVSQKFMSILAEVMCQILSKACKKMLDHYLESCLKIDKSYVTEKAQQLFFEADPSPEGKALIMDYMKEPIKVEKRICSERYDELAFEKVEQILKTFSHQLKIGRANASEFFETLLQELGHKEISGKKLDDKHKQDFLTYIYASVLKQIGGENLQDFLAKKNDIEDSQIWEETYIIPPFAKSLFTINHPLADYYDSSSDDKQTIDLQLVPQLHDNDINMFLEFLLGFKTSDEITQKISGFEQRLRDELDAEVRLRQYYTTSENDALGCSGECIFCGARCTQVTQCGEGVDHQSDWHRPMAFKGTHEKDKESGKKHLLKDFCTSRENIESRWPKIDSKLSESTHVLQRLRDMDLYVSGTNVYLEWSTGSDLDIQVQCCCSPPKWHGYGTSGGSEGSCYCEPCEMKRDHDVQTGHDGRKAFEHVYFSTFRKLIGKTIRVAVYNYQNNTNQSRNDFEICISNQYGYQLFPDAGSSTIEHHASWMYTSASAKQRSQERSYTFKPEDEKKGIEDFTVKFPQHVKDNGHNWYFSAGDAAQKKEDRRFIAFIQKCNEKWAFVKREMCEHYGAEILDDVNML